MRALPSELSRLSNWASQKEIIFLWLNHPDMWLQERNYGFIPLYKLIVIGLYRTINP
jgi:hypothetical protein